MGECVILMPSVLHPVNTAGDIDTAAEVRANLCGTALAMTDATFRMALIRRVVAFDDAKFSE